MRLASNITAASNDSAAQLIQSQERGVYAVVQADISAAATVLVQGRAAGDLSWVTVTEFTASGAEVVMVFREMRTSITSNTGTVDVELDV